MLRRVNKWQDTCGRDWVRSRENVTVYVLVLLRTLPGLKDSTLSVSNCFQALFIMQGHTHTHKTLKQTHAYQLSCFVSSQSSLMVYIC